MREMLRGCLAAAIARLHSHAEPAGLDIADVDESTFRFFVLAEIKRRDPGSKCQREWNGIDLVVETSTGRKAAIEFKLYALRRTYPLDDEGGGKPHWKGSASAQNLREFNDCVTKLRKLRHKEIHEKYLVLVHERKQHGHKKSFEESYADVKDRFGADALKVENSWGDAVACTLIQVQ
jgi:hypothetical protein